MCALTDERFELALAVCSGCDKDGLKQHGVCEPSTKYFQGGGGDGSYK